VGIVTDGFHYPGGILNFFINYRNGAASFSRNRFCLERSSEYSTSTPPCDLIRNRPTIAKGKTRWKSPDLAISTQISPASGRGSISISSLQAHKKKTTTASNLAQAAKQEGIFEKTSKLAHVMHVYARISQ
jgi:hypothetical protein